MPCVPARAAAGHNFISRLFPADTQGSFLLHDQMPGGYMSISLSANGGRLCQPVWQWHPYMARAGSGLTIPLHPPQHHPELPRSCPGIACVKFSTTLFRRNRPVSLRYCGGGLSVRCCDPLRQMAHAVVRMQSETGLDKPPASQCTACPDRLLAWCHRGAGAGSWVY